MSDAPGHPWFSRFGVELEYMLVDRHTLEVLPLADRVLIDAAGEPTSELEQGAITWSNELVLHVVELKLTEPATQLAGCARLFAESIHTLNQRLAGLGACLLPSGMHPWMNPLTETRLWPHDYGEFYATFDRIFNCKGHGWSNLQSAHLNLPFADDDQFARLHAAIRWLLPLLPALAASSPYCEGRASGLLDTRLEVYRHNCVRVPETTGQVIPEAVASAADYEQRILQPLYRAIAPLDSAGTLQHEWLNARGAIARFERAAIEIRVLDTQEHPAADLAILAAVTAVLQALVREQPLSYAQQLAWPQQPLVELLLATLRHGEQARIEDREYLAACGLCSTRAATVAEAWQAMIETYAPHLLAAGCEHAAALRVLWEQGSLARRLLRSAGPEPSRERLREVYSQLADCLAQQQPFLPA